MHDDSHAQNANGRDPDHLVQPCHGYPGRHEPGKDGIPSIDEPRFISPSKANQWLAAEDRIIGFCHNGQAKAYPQAIVVSHEIVNDGRYRHPQA